MDEGNIVHRVIVEVTGAQWHVELSANHVLRDRLALVAVDADGSILLLFIVLFGLAFQMVEALDHSLEMYTEKLRL